MAATFLAWEEVSDFHATGLIAIERSVFGAELVEAVGPHIWAVLLSPLIVAFAIAMWAFARKGLRTRATRVPFALALVAWLLAVAHEASGQVIFEGRADALEIVLEETVEFGGTLLIGLSAVIALRSDTASRPPSDLSGGRRIRAALAVDVTFALTFIVFIPAFLAAVALPPTSAIRR